VPTWGRKAKNWGGGIAPPVLQNVELLLQVKRQNHLKVGTEKPKLKVTMQSVSDDDVRKRLLEKTLFELAAKGVRDSDSYSNFYPNLKLTILTLHFITISSVNCTIYMLQTVLGLTAIQEGSMRKCLYSLIASNTYTT